MRKNVKNEHSVRPVLDLCGLKMQENVCYHAERDLMGIAKSINPSQHGQSAQAYHSQNFSLLADFLCIK